MAFEPDRKDIGLEFVTGKSNLAIYRTAKRPRPSLPPLLSIISVAISPDWSFPVATQILNWLGLKISVRGGPSLPKWLKHNDL